MNMEVTNDHHQETSCPCSNPSGELVFGKDNATESATRHHRIQASGQALSETSRDGADVILSATQVSLVILKFLLVEFLTFTIDR